MMKKKQDEFMINFDYLFYEYNLMHSSHMKYLSSDSDIKAHALKIWKQIMMSISDYCKEHNCLNEFKWQFIEIETFESQKNSETEHKPSANSLGASDKTADASFTQNVPDNQRDWLLDALPQDTSQDDEPELMDTSGLPLSHEGHPILGKCEVLKKWQYLVWLKENVAV